MKIEQIIISQRRREDLGDLAGLAESIKKYGLIHPIVIDESNVLVAGERRLRACQILGWKEIDVRPFGELTEVERREIELEENIRRKDLTPIERSRELVKNAEEIAPKIADRISSESDEKDSRGRKSEYEAPKEDIARAIGVGKTTLIEAEQHVVAVEKYPDLADKSQSGAIKEAKRRDEEVPEPTIVDGVVVDGNHRMQVKTEPQQEKSVDTSRDWLKNLQRFRKAFAEIETGGGIGKIAQSWTVKGRQEILAEIAYIQAEFQRWLGVLAE